MAWKQNPTELSVYVKSCQNLLLSLKQSVERLEPISGKEEKMEQTNLSRQRKWWVLMYSHFRFLAGPLSPQYLSCIVKNGSINTFCFHDSLHGSWLERSIMCLRLCVIRSLFFSVYYYNVCEQVWSKQSIYNTQQCGLSGQHISKAVESGFRESWQITTVFIIVTASVGVWFNLINITVGAQWQ